LSLKEDNNDDKSDFNKLFNDITTEEKKINKNDNDNQ